MIPYDKAIYKDRDLVERYFCKIKYFHRNARPYEKTAPSSYSMLSLIGAMICLR